MNSISLQRPEDRRGPEITPSSGGGARTFRVTSLLSPADFGGQRERGIGSG